MNEPVADRTTTIVAPLSALVLSTLASVACCILLGPTLGLAFSGFAVVTILSPQFASMAGASVRHFILVQACIVLPIVVGWAWATVLKEAWPMSALGWMTALIVSYAAIVAVTTKLLSRLIPAAFAIAAVTVAGYAWLSWPIWTGAWMTETIAARLIAPHPLFAINSITGSAPWPEHPVIYGMSRLGQDISYAMPESCWPAIGLNVVGTSVSAALLAVICRVRKRSHAATT